MLFVFFSKPSEIEIFFNKEFSPEKIYKPMISLWKMKKLMTLSVFAFFLLGMMFSFSGVLADENDTDNSSIGNSEVNDSVSDNGTEITNGSDDEIETENDADVDEEAEVETEDMEEVDNETRTEVEEMDVVPGATLRMLQLQRQILIHVLRAEVVVDSLKTLGKNTTELESIVEELKLLREDAKIIPSTKEEAVQKFIDIKTEAKSLVRQFREGARALTTESERSEIRINFKNIRDSAELTALNGQIINALRNLHKIRVENVLSSLGFEDEELIAKILSGEIGGGEIKIKLREYYDSLSEEEREAVKDRLREIRIEMRADRIKVIRENIDGRKERLEIRLDERISKLEREGHKIASERLKKASGKIQDRMLEANNGNSGEGSNSEGDDN